ncbi:MAG TPA: HPF/RaiA family ribosome-associated protein [Flavobacteriaceae bacterium]|nr:ribosome-associated translation inhibitor RaiA [Flavobacteriaceae bacterium]MCB9212462.1 ribosome-associated translation inhibitor RaiA [Alteromonas sp.]HPF10525.1 HPF/RaiA family ribosome-associated protein [Flavobacteriaceae bacterium]HQU20213.1 HPF/RaiA family ribosome-associated protein [Flavobacteriaceae bacterium]HQU66045.1 HPF/RaiA family ribosome-associated protein [Flavobacteriaceae bacterium]
MTTNIQFVKMPTSETLTEFTNKRIKKLAVKYNWIIHTEVFFKLDTDAFGTKICEMELSVPGPKIFASSKDDNFEVAVKHTITELEKQLKKRKEVTFRLNH